MSKFLLSYFVQVAWTKPSCPDAARLLLLCLIFGFFNVYHTEALCGGEGEGWLEGGGSLWLMSQKLHLIGWVSRTDSTICSIRIILLLLLLLAYSWARISGNGVFCGGKNKDKIYRGTVPLRVESKCAKAGYGGVGPCVVCVPVCLPLKCLPLSCVEILQQDWGDGRFKRYFYSSTNHSSFLCHLFHLSLPPALFSSFLQNGLSLSLLFPPPFSLNTTILFLLISPWVRSDEAITLPVYFTTLDPSLGVSYTHCMFFYSMCVNRLFTKKPYLCP